MYTILLEDTWLEDAQDIIDYCSDLHYEYHIYSVDELYEFDSIKFFAPNNVYFCNTDIVQYHLNKVNLWNLTFVPDTYEQIYQQFYKRNIQRRLYGSIDQNTELPLFMKPVTNDKIFDGQVFYSEDTFLGKIPTNDTMVYTTDVLTILSEYRLLIGNSKLYGKGLISGINLDDVLPNKMINEICNCTDNLFRCIDIGYSKELKNWIIIEINPPFSLDDHHIPLADYMTFCIDSCKNINSYVSNKHVV